MKRICVYCGSNMGSRPEYREAAILLGKELVRTDIELVYGGSKLGLMGELANQVLADGGKVTGVMPGRLFPKEVINTALTKFIEVTDMHERKKIMADLADGFIALPGGMGTYEELFETLSWAQIGIHKKPIGVLNVDGFYEPLLKMLKNTVTAGFMKESNLELLLASDSSKELIEKLIQYQTPALGVKWRELKG